MSNEARDLLSFSFWLEFQKDFPFFGWSLRRGLIPPPFNVIPNEVRNLRRFSFGWSSRRVSLPLRLKIPLKAGHRFRLRKSLFTTRMSKLVAIPLKAGHRFRRFIPIKLGFFSFIVAIPLKEGHRFRLLDQVNKAWSRAIGRNPLKSGAPIQTFYSYKTGIF
jgi:hypothetical protein